VSFGYVVLDRATKAEIMSTGAISADNFIQKGNPVIPVALAVRGKEMKAGQYTLVLMAIDSAGGKATNRIAEFDLTE